LCKIALPSSIVNGVDKISSITKSIISPYDKKKILGQVNYADASIINEAIESLNSFNNEWKNSPLSKRIDIVQKFSILLESNYHLLVSCCVKEAGKTIHDSIADIREAIDFCRYYAVEAERIFEEKNLPGPTGEKNIYKLKARGLTCVISPWNFPIAIFIGQMIASLVCGNVTIVKPAEQTSYLSYVIFKLLLSAGLPNNAAALILGRGESIGPQIFSHKNLQNVVFTGSLETAKIIQKQLYERDDLINLIAETGGLNCLIADSSALTEHIVEDVINSAFNSAGQRCSACRILCIEENVYKKTLSMLKGAVDALSVSSPENISTDIGPVIDEEAKERINHHIKSFIKKYQSNHLNNNGFFVNPTILEINKIDEVKEEVFGPVLHVLSFNSKNIVELCNQINSLNYGLTIGIHSRIDKVIDTVINNSNVGNIYINRNIVGAVVGSQPFGGHHKSGTGPKAGGPEYLKKFCYEYSISSNLVAMGGNVDLLSQVYD
ncbi:L-glutamate gamma-semialdehyde dehydrogenase, partial [Pelagibacterales bacterium SAG-MED31]|nr:L-glutamate gamma-semialdehyde dehydrogenase [Pelagibacterales bacterium SAG-MED31]